MTWVQLSVQVCAGQIDETMRVLEEMGSQATTQQNAGEDSYFDLAHPSEPGWDVQKITALFDPKHTIEGLRGELLDQLAYITEVEVQMLADQDWETAWLDQYQPIQVTPSLWIYPSWVDATDDSHTVIKIDPGMAFGTGTHETTRLCMQLLARLNITGQGVLDYGCGSGILGITALKLGAHSAVGVDIDPKAERVSLENALINGVESRFAIQSAADVDTQEFDTVVANILAFALIDLSSNLISRTREHGHLILSGILAHQADDVIAAYQHCFEFERVEESGWVALLGCKKT